MSEGDSNTQLLAQQTSITFIGNVVGKFFRLAFYIIITSLVSPSVFGLYTLGLSIILFIERFADLNLHRSIDYFVPKYISEGRETEAIDVVTFVFILSGLTTLLSALIVYLVRNSVSQLFGEQRLSLVLGLMIVLIPILSLNRAMYSLFIGVKKIQYRAILKDIIVPILKTVCVAILLVAGFQVNGLIIGHIIAVTISLCIGGYIAYHKLEFLRRVKRPRDINAKKIINYSLPLVFAGMIYSTIGQIDYYIIGYFMDAEDVGIYRIGYLLSGYVLLFHSSLSPVFKPLVAESSISDIKPNYKLAVKWVTLLTIPLGIVLIIMPKYFINLLFSESYVAASLPAIILVGGRVVNIGIGPGGKTLEGFGRTRITLINSIFLLLSNTIADLLLVPRYGIIGAAAGTASALIFTTLLVITELNYLYDIFPFDMNTLKVWISGITTLGLLYPFTSSIHLKQVEMLLIPLLAIVIYLALIIALNCFTEADLEIANKFDTFIGQDIFSRLIRYRMK